MSAKKLLLIFLFCGCFHGMTWAEGCMPILSDQSPHNNGSELSLMIGPPGVQNGHSNPVGIPPTLTDISIVYVNTCGKETRINLVPGPGYGFRFREGRRLYASLGVLAALSANGLGPGIYTALGANLARTNFLSFDVEYQMAMALSVVESTSLTFPSALRIGGSIRW